MTAEPELVKAQCGALISRLKAKADSPNGASGQTARDSLVLRLHSQYEGDVGVLSSYFLNMVGVCRSVSVHPNLKLLRTRNHASSVQSRGPRSFSCALFHEVQNGQDQPQG